MPSRIPVCIADKSFPSLNQARGHYLNILHRYQPGQSVNEQDRQDVERLVACSGAGLPNSAGLKDVRVVHGNYGRTCLAHCGASNSPQVISITRSVKHCAVSKDAHLGVRAEAPSAQSGVDAVLTTTTGRVEEVGLEAKAQSAVGA
ncbi:MAG: hypothetical protein KDD78_17150 [Caldilineaceae bacterium]|nr:hypothetical protein [Caldilineaceae bacterium]